MKRTLLTFDLLEQTHAFPGPFLFKIIGKADHAFVARVVAIIREELFVDVDPPCQVRESAGGRHLSVTLEPVVQSPQQILAIYRRLGTIEGLVMLL